MTQTWHYKVKYKINKFHILLEIERILRTYTAENWKLSLH